jgi:hypothetical protein
MAALANRKRVYVAGPLSSSGERLENVRNAIRAGVELIKLGYAPLVPHLTHYMDGNDSLGHDTWLAVDLPWVETADALLRLPGPSKGADQEVERAKARGIPVAYSLEELQSICPSVLTLSRQAGMKHDADKLRYDLIPARPLAEVAKVYTLGAKKYADRNWEKGLHWGRVFAALQRHAWAWWVRQQNDPQDGQHHLASVAWCALALLEYEQTHPELDDRPP